MLKEGPATNEQRNLGNAAKKGLEIDKIFQESAKKRGTYQMVAWPSGLRRWIKAPVSSGAWVRIPPLPGILAYS